MPRSSTNISTGLPQLRSQAVSSTVWTTLPMRPRSQRPVTGADACSRTSVPSMLRLRRQASIVAAASAASSPAWGTGGGVPAANSLAASSWRASRRRWAALSRSCSRQSLPLAPRRRGDRGVAGLAEGRIQRRHLRRQLPGDRPQQGVARFHLLGLGRPRARAGGAARRPAAGPRPPAARAPPDRGPPTSSIPSERASQGVQHPLDLASNRPAAGGPPRRRRTDCCTGGRRGSPAGGCAACASADPSRPSARRTGTSPPRLPCAAPR